MRFPLIQEDGTVFVVTDKEKDYLDYFVQTGGDDVDARKKAGMTKEAVKEFMDSDRIRHYVKLKVTQAARRGDISLDTVLDRLHQIAFGKLDVGRQEMKALEILASYLQILKPPQTTVNVKLTSEDPLKLKSDKEIDQMLLEASKHGTD